MLQQTSERMRFPRHPVLPTHNVLLRLPRSPRLQSMSHQEWSRRKQLTKRRKTNQPPRPPRCRPKTLYWRKRRERRTPRLSLRKLSRKARQWKRQRQANRAATNLLQTSRLHLPTRASPATKSPLGMLLAMRSSERAPPRLRRRTLLWIPKLQSRSQMQMQMTQRQSNSQVRRR